MIAEWEPELYRIDRYWPRKRERMSASIAKPAIDSSASPRHPRRRGAASSATSAAPSSADDEVRGAPLARDTHRTAAHVAVQVHARQHPHLSSGGERRARIRLHHKDGEGHRFLVPRHRGQAARCLTRDARGDVDEAGVARATRPGACAQRGTYRGVRRRDPFDKNRWGQVATRLLSGACAITQEFVIIQLEPGERAGAAADWLPDPSLLLLNGSPIQLVPMHDAYRHLHIITRVPRGSPAVLGRDLT